MKFKTLEVEYIPEILEQGIIYVSQRFKTAIHLCACGRGGKTVTPLSGDYSWELSLGEGGGYLETFYREFPYEVQVPLLDNQRGGSILLESENSIILAMYFLVILGLWGELIWYRRCQEKEAKKLPQSQPVIAYVYYQPGDEYTNFEGRSVLSFKKPTQIEAPFGYSELVHRKEPLDGHD